MRSPERPVRLLGARGSAGALLVARLRVATRAPLLVIAPTTARAERFADDLRTFTRGPEVLRLPRYDTPPFDRFSPHPEIEARRMSLLYRLLSADAKTPLTLVAPWSALLRRVPPRRELRARVSRIERGMTVDRDALLEVLVAAGYHRTAVVEERGEVAVRGGILDLFPPQLERPVRVEIEFDEVGSIREFDPGTQRSQDEQIRVVAIPPRSYRLPPDVDLLLAAVRKRGRERQLPESNIYSITEALARRHLPVGIENLEALLHDGAETLFDYLVPETRIVIDDPEAGLARARAYTEEIFEGHARATAQDRLVCDPLELYLTGDTAWEQAQGRHPVLLDPLGATSGDPGEDRITVRAPDHAALRREIQEQRGSGRALAPLGDRLDAWQEAGRQVRIVCPSLSSAERLADILRDYGHPMAVAAETARTWDTRGESPRHEILVAKLHAGFDLGLENLVVLTEEDIFGARVPRRAAPASRSFQAIDRLAQIQDGDFLVHAEHGIGRYAGLTQLTVAGVLQEFLLILYGQGDKLYLPISRLGQVQRYSGAEDAKPVVDRLGGQVWSRVKRKARRAVRDMAEQLLAVSAAREALEGHGVPAPGPDYEEFEAGFPWEDTADQRRATEEVLVDLQRTRPMDRLVCGDVGFGKTEIACRAAYLVAVEGRQVALLVPTTVLCQQHLETLRERFEGTALEVAGLSRLSTPKQVREAREGLASGRIDIVVGTHRLLSRDVQFRSLGLVIVDEEHRFGVAHKERLKQLRKLVDVLTLSATPIPRTLQMAISGMRDLSVITTPPPDRIAVRTHIARFSDDIVREAILREMRRGGQIFFVHNRVETIEEIGEYLRRLVPEARIAVAHGQMPAQQLERVMLAFLRHERDVLLSTAIIESGLDIPNANTILIHRADHFGLAQLHQLRGRVGRSDRRAYAYLFLPPEGQLTDDARRRIEAIQDLAELGAGFRLATHDLEIRGAGNLLGAEQSGHIAAVGYDLYVEMLEQAMAELRGESLDESVEPEIQLPVPALLPSSYVPEVAQRLVAYKRLSSLRDPAELEEVRADLLDRYGPLPPESRNLLELIRLKLGCRALGIEAIESAGRDLVLRVGERPRIDPERVLHLLAQPQPPFRVEADQRIRLTLRKPEDALAESFGLLELLAPGQSGVTSVLPPAAEGAA